MIANDLLANLNDNQYATWRSSIEVDSRNFDNYFSAKQNTVDGQMSALEMSNAYMSLKQRKPMTLEFYRKYTENGKETYKKRSIRLYINPERMQISHQKIIGQTYTRAGIFYHHFGDNNPSMSLNGTTGLSGMTGIRQLEEAYYASGTLLKYNNYNKINLTNGALAEYTNLNYSDPISVLSSTTSSNYNTSKINEIQQQLLQYSSANSNNNNSAYNHINYLSVYKNDATLKNFMNNELPNLYNEISNWDSNSYVSYRTYYSKILSRLNSIMPNMSNEIKSNIAYELSMEKLYSNLSSADYAASLDTEDADTLVAMNNLNTARKVALSSYFNELKDFDNREKQIKDTLEKNLINNMNFELTDPWLPRRIIIYYDTRTYIGHFESFNYTIDSKTNLINYDIKFLIEQIYQFNNTNIMASTNTTTTQKTQTTVSTTKSGKQFYTCVKGDTINKIAKKFLGDDKLWPEIYAESVNDVVDPANAYPGLVLTIPASVNPSYWRWVVQKGDTIQSISKRFYGDSSKYKKIYDANQTLITMPGYILKVKSILKIPR